MHFFNDPAPPGNVIDYLEVSEDCYEYCFPKRDIEVWNTGDFYLDGDGFFIHKDCDQDNRTTIRYVLQKTSGHWDIVPKVKVPQINRRGKAVKRLTMDCDKWLVFYPQKDYKRYCAPQRLPVWLPHSFADTLPQWDRDDQDTVQDLFYLVVGYTTPMKAKIFKVEHGPIHKWTDLSKHHPQLVEDLEVEALMSAQKILSDNALEEMGDSVDSPYTTRTKKAVEFLSRFVHAAVTVVAMVVTIVKQHLEGRSDIAKEQRNLVMLEMTLICPTKPQQHLEGRSDIAKDQRNLVMLEMTLVCHLQSAKLGAIEQGWTAELALFDLNIKYHAQKQNTNADALSRHPGQKKQRWRVVNWRWFYRRRVLLTTGLDTRVQREYFSLYVDKSSPPNSQETWCGPPSTARTSPCHSVSRVVAIDFTKLEVSADGKEDILVLTDVFTKWTVDVAKKDQSSMSVVKVLLKEWIPHLGFHADFTLTKASVSKLTL
ncbi:hypothetical protein RRG08_012766 [Elysia crispata]|uniref:Integrase catalytic domain-containing protein n=1 Tax=Elysia crispata TaxID=231223 RepID=A0AAE0YRE3_9GAST|nr:hypothetical protein RRG08_012766 [Elysia crispata]